MSAMIDPLLAQRDLALRLQSAQTLLESGDLDAAAEAYDALRAQGLAPVSGLVGLALVALGRSDPAAALARADEALRLDPEALPAHLARAHALSSLQRLEAATQAFRQACRIAPASVEAITGLAAVLQQRGQVDEAARVLERALKHQPEEAELRIAFAALLRRRGQWRRAQTCLQQLLAVTPDHLPAQLLLGELLQAHGDAEAARRCFEAVLRQAPEHAPAWMALGALMLQGGHADAAMHCLQCAVHHDPRQPTAWLELGRLKAEQQRAEAIQCFEQGLRLDPDVPPALVMLGKLLIQEERHADAATCLLRAAELATGDPYTHYLCGMALRGTRMVEASIDQCRRALTLQPAPNVHNALLYLLALNCMETGRTREAMTCAQQLIERGVGIETEQANPHELLARMHAQMGEGRLALEAYRRVVEAAPKALLPRANLCMATNYADHLDGAAQLALRREVMRPLASLPRPRAHANDRDPDRRLRVGYLSGDFRDHSCAHFLAPLLQHHDRGAFELCAYSTVTFEDAVTERLRGHFHTWRDVRSDTAQALADRIRNDRIDILVDLAWVTEGGRPAALARKPAPVQIEWLGFLGSTGLEAMDYRITDAWVDPPGSEPLAVERPLRLTGPYVCFAPPLQALPVAPLPMLGREGPVLASFNNLAKVSDATVALWAEVLRALPTAKLLLKALVLADAGVREHTLARFARHGIGAERLDLRARLEDTAHHLSLYNEVDVALDTYPYNGVTTTCEALWMGVPVVSLHGDAIASRQGLSLLHAVGEGDLAVATPQAYVEACRRLVAKPVALAQRRSELRSRMRASALVDGAAHARRMEAAYRHAWRAWCAGAASGAPA